MENFHSKEKSKEGNEKEIKKDDSCVKNLFGLTDEEIDHLYEKDPKKPFDN